MSRLLGKFKNVILIGFFVTLLGLACETEVNALDCQPATPCPCAADGTCRPQGPWGHSQTRWRPWPGDVIDSKQSTQEEEEKQEQLMLEPYETPIPEKEALRGAETPESRKKKPKSDGGAIISDPLGGAGQDLGGPVPGEIPAAEPQQPVAQPGGLDGFDLPEAEAPAEDAPLPEEEPLDDFDPFSDINQRMRAPKTVKQPAATTPQLPASGPPSLPASLQKLSQTMRPTPSQRRGIRRPGYRSATTVALAN